jgi:uncharacterized membrane protein
MQLRFQGPVTGLLLYAAYLTAVCPCVKTLSCHQREFYVAKVAEAPGTRKGFTSLLGVRAAGGVFPGIRGLFGGVGEWVGDHPVESVAPAST